MIIGLCRGCFNSWQGSPKPRPMPSAMDIGAAKNTASVRQPWKTNLEMSRPIGVNGCMTPKGALTHRRAGSSDRPHGLCLATRDSGRRHRSRSCARNSRAGRHLKNLGRADVLWPCDSNGARPKGKNCHKSGYVADFPSPVCSDGPTNVAGISRPERATGLMAESSR